MAEARARHRESLAELPPYALQLSRGYPAIPTVFEAGDPEAEPSGAAMRIVIKSGLVPAGPLERVRYVPVHTDDFAEFYEASYRRMVALVAAIVGDRYQAEDIAQEAFAALTRWQRIARYDAPEAWVRRVASGSPST